jgi:glycosyltransferase involved in cell wall biosynthesis
MEMMLSVIVPVYNRADLIEKTLNSILEQSYRPLELIIVDNNSSDASYEACCCFRDQHQSEEFKVLVVQEDHPGANAARNKGWRKASGDYLLFFDSDDQMFPDCLLTIYNELYRTHFPKIIAFPFQIRFQDGRMAFRPNHYGKNAVDQLLNPIFSTHNICFRRTLFGEIAPWDEKLQRWQDLEFGFRLLLNVQEWCWIKGPALYEVLDHEHSISSAAYWKDHIELARTLEQILKTIILQPEGKEKSRLLRAWCFKTTSMAAELKKEGCTDIALTYRKRACDELPEARKRWSCFILWLHYFYTSLGGRGFWRCANIII